MSGTKRKGTTMTITTMTITLQKTRRGWFWQVDGEDGMTIRDADAPHATAAAAAREAEAFITTREKAGR